jgi:RNA polymerase I-specific transcription initiation factor RRN7
VEPASTKDGPVPTPGPEEEKTNDDADADGNDSTDSEEGDQTEKEEGQGDIDEDILAELSDLSDVSDAEQRGGSVAAAGKGPKWRRRRRLKVSDTLVTLILGLWIMKVPIMNADIES